MYYYTINIYANTIGFLVLKDSIWTIFKSNFC